MSDDPLVQGLFEVQQFFALGFEHTGDGDASPAGDNLGDVLAIDLLLDEHLGVGLHVHQPLIEALQFGLHGGDLSVTDLGYLGVVAGPLLAHGLVFQFLDALLGLLDAEYHLALAFPLGAQFVAALFEVGEVLVDALDLRLVGLPLDSLALDLELADAALDLVEFLGHGVHLQAQAGGGLVD